MIDWVLSHLDIISEWFALLVATCTGVAGLTPTKKDDGVVSKIVKFADLFSLVNTKENREKLEKALKKK